MSDNAEKKTLVLLPGLLCDEAAWKPQVDYFSTQYEVLVANYGDADSLELMAQRALEQSPERFALAAHSMGARVALELMVIAPERVSRLALLDTGVHGVQEGEAVKRFALRDLGREQGMKALVDKWLPPMVHPSRLNDKALMQPLYDMAISPGVEGFERQITALLGRRDAVPLLSSIRCPVLIAVGELDVWSPPSQHEAMLEELNAPYQYVVFPNSGHMAPVEVPELVNAALDEWLEFSG